MQQKFKVKGMDCASCVSRIEAAVGKIEGVADVGVNLSTETLSATVRDDVANERVVKTVKALGYNVVSIVNPRPENDGFKSGIWRFRVKGMDCGSCAQKIEGALRGVRGVSDVSVNTVAETLVATITDRLASESITRTVTNLGFRITLLSFQEAGVKVDEKRSAMPSATEAEKDHADCGHDHHDGHHHGHDHGAHGQDHNHSHHHGHRHNEHATLESADHGRQHFDEDRPTSDDGAWWDTTKGRLVIATGLLLLLSFAVSWRFPEESSKAFIIACFIGAVPVAYRAINAARHGIYFTIEMLMVVATVGALAIGASEEAAVVVFLFAVGEFLEGLAANRARSGIKALTALAPKTAQVETPNGLREVEIDDLRVGETVVVRSGDRVPADGLILSGISSLDESPLTGESVPKSKRAGDVVYAGSINGEATLRIKVQSPASETLIARVIELVGRAAQAKAPTERFIEKFARYYMPCICLLAFVVMVLPPLAFGEPWNVWIYRGLALLLIGCPCALVISTPAAVSSAMAAGTRRGLLVKGGEVLEAIGKVKSIAFDKTGTLTEGKPSLVDVIPSEQFTTEQLLRLAASVEATSSHPLAKATVLRAQSDGIKIDTSLHATNLPGEGVQATVDGKDVFVGATRKADLSGSVLSQSAESLQQQGKTLSLVLVNNKIAGILAYQDELRKDAVQGVRELKKLGIDAVILTGDTEQAAFAVAKRLDVNVKAGLLPADKLAVINDMSREGPVAVVGDGINDAPALAAASVGIAMGSGTDVALETADAAILRNQVRDVALLVALSRKALTIIRQNVAVALGLKALFLATTVFGLTGLWIAILADTGATVIVTMNSLRLLRKSEA